jgi:hypothetical protein
MITKGTNDPTINHLWAINLYSQLNTKLVVMGNNIYADIKSMSKLTFRRDSHLWEHNYRIQQKDVQY